MNPNPPTIAPLTYEPALDGLRAIAAIAVIGVHSWVPWLSGGFLGVDLFFVLSGYLITRSLAHDGRISHFYLRRLRRLAPALGFMLLAYLAVYSVLLPEYSHARDALFAFFYLSDYTYAFWRMPIFLGHTWSLSVEEHFYLLWPLVFLRLRPSVGFLVCLYLIATWWRWQHDDWLEAYYRFDMRLSGLLLGCLLAHLPRPRFPAWPGMLGLALAFVLMERTAWYTPGPGMVFAELCAAAAVFGVPPKWLSSPSLVYLGKLSYGMYLWHFPLTKWLHRLQLPWEAIFPIALLFSMVMAAISYHLIEAWFRKRQTVHADGPALDTSLPALK